MDRKMFKAFVLVGVLACFTTASFAGMIDHDRVAKRRARLGLMVVKGVVGDIDYRNNEVIVKDSQASKEYRFVVDSGIIQSLSKGAGVEVSFYQGSNVPASFNLVKQE